LALNQDQAQVLALAQARPLEHHQAATRSQENQLHKSTII
jgi:hypothetical protein